MQISDHSFNLKCYLIVHVCKDTIGQQSISVYFLILVKRFCLRTNPFRYHSVSVTFYIVIFFTLLGFYVIFCFLLFTVFCQVFVTVGVAVKLSFSFSYYSVIFHAFVFICQISNRFLLVIRLLLKRLITSYYLEWQWNQVNEICLRFH